MNNNDGSWDLPALNTRMFVRQKTLGASIDGTGVGLHTGRKVSITLSPAPPDTGLVIKRADIANGGSLIPLSWCHVVDSQLATTVGNEHGISVSTVEHVMAALAGCEVDNAIIQVDGPEFPIMDGSAAPFVKMIDRVGVVEQPAPRRAIKVLRPIRVEDGDKFLSLLPADNFGVDFEIEFASDAIAHQDLSVTMVNGTFRADIARARTFGFEHEVTALRNAGFALGGSLENAIVISGDKVLNEEGLRYDDEFVRHKILDCIGDLYLAGAPIIGQVEARCSGHDLNHRILRALFEDDDAWCYTMLGADAPIEEEAQRATA